MPETLGQEDPGASLRDEKNGRWMMQCETEISVQELDAVTVLDICGDITVLSEPAFQAAYQKVEELGATKIVLNFWEDMYMNSEGILALNRLLAQMQRNNQQVAISGLSRHFMKVFDLIGISHVVRVYDSLEDALTAMSRN